MFSFNNQNRNNINNQVSNIQRQTQNIESVSNNVNVSNQNEIATNNLNNNMNVNNNQILKALNNSSSIVSFEALQKARQDLIGEMDAIIEYDNHIHTSNIEIAKAIWEDIRNEELNHIGQLLALIIHLAPYQKELIENGVKEFENFLNNIKH